MPSHPGFYGSGMFSAAGGAALVKALDKAPGLQRSRFTRALPAKGTALGAGCRDQKRPSAVTRRAGSPNETEMEDRDGSHVRMRPGDQRSRLSQAAPGQVQAPGTSALVDLVRTVITSNTDQEVLVFANGNSFGSSNGEGNERSILSSRWMFPGGSCGIQQLGNAS